MSVTTTTDKPPADCGGELEFFGFQLRVTSPRLAALLSGDAEDRVQVVRAGEDASADTRPEARGPEVSWRGPHAETCGVVVRLRRLASDA